MKFVFTGSEKVTSDVTSFMFKSEQSVSWTPGQYFHYSFPHQNEDDRGHERWFTNSAAPFENKIMISTRIASDHGSSFKHALLNLKPGDSLEADGPKGSFVIEDPSRNYVFVAGGIGITPFRSILAEADHNNQKLNISLLYANRKGEIPFKEELDKFAASNPNLKIDYVDEPRRLDGEIIKKAIDAIDNPLVYISGPKPMVNDLAEQLKALGVSEDVIVLDTFPGYENY